VYHKVTAVGRVGGDAEMRYTSKGDPVTSFSVATDVGWGDNKKTVWFRVTAWKKLAEICNEYVRKGMMILVEGTLAEPRVYETKGGEHRASLDLTAREVKFLSSKRASEQTNPDVVGIDEMPNEEIPF